ncbi:telomere-protecting terminal protein Tpg [Streptomyces sp. NPDC058864]
MTIDYSATTVQEALDLADARHWTQQPPRSDRARLRFLLRRNGHDPKALAARLGTTANTLEQALQQRRIGDPQLQRSVQREVVRLWQPRVRQQAHAAIIRHDGEMTIAFRAWFGFTVAAGSSDDPRLRFLTVQLKNPYPRLLFDARHRQADEQELQRILADALAVSYFKHARTTTLQSVSLTNIDYLEFYY